MAEVIARAMFEFERDYWNQRYLNHDPRGSGGGSYGEPMLRKVELLGSLPGVESIIELGCGDFNFGKHLTDRLPTVKYDGFDISDVVIERNQQYFKTSSPRIEFHELQGNRILPADLVLCVDVLFHILNDDDYEAMLQNLEKLWVKYLAVSAYEHDGPENMGHMRIRKFDPARFGVPVVRETIEEDGGMQFYLFKAR